MVYITGNPSAGQIQVDKAGELRQMDFDLSKGMHIYEFDCAQVNSFNDGNGYTYAQIAMDEPEGETYGQLLGYEVTFSDSTPSVQEGTMDYPELTIPTAYTFRGNTYNNGYNYGNEMSLFTFNLSPEDTEKISTVKAWIYVTGNPTWGGIQVNKAGEIRAMYYDCSKGIHEYEFDCAQIEGNDDGNGWTYSQILFGGAANETYGQLLGYEITFSDSTPAILSGVRNYPEFIIPTDLTATVGQTLADVTLPTVNNGTWTWADSTASVGEAGANTFSATFTPNDSNLQTVTNIQVTVTVAPDPDQEAADEVADTINALPTEVTVDDKDTIEAARAAYEALTDAQKDLVEADVLAKLEAAEEALAAAEQAAADQDAADAVAQMMNALPNPENVTVADKNAIEAAGYAYAALTNAQKALIDPAVKARYAAIAQAFAIVAEEAANQAAAEGVTYLIDQIPAEVTENDRETVENARKAYEMLTDEQKALVSEDTLKKLTDAEYALNPDKLVNTSSISAEKVAKGSAITINASAEGGTAPYKYTYRCKKTDATTWKYLATNLDVTELNYKPKSVGTYDIQVLVKDASGRVVTKGIKLNVVEELKNDSTISATSVAAGSAVTLTAKATGGIAPYTYTLRCKKSDATTWKYLAANTDNETLTYKPNSEGTYDIQVLVKDASGKVVVKGFKLTVTEALKNNSAISATSVAAGESVTLNANAQGGTAPYTYTYRCKKSDASSWKYLAANTDKTTLNYKPNSAGTYDIQVLVKDSSGKVVTRGFKLNVT